jgi:predicted DNA-binding transcriptional regulator YafY
VRATVRLRLPAAEALELVPRTVGVHRPDGPRATVVVVGGGSVAGLTRYLAGLGVPVEVLDPPELRASLRSHAEALAATNLD